MIRRRQNTERDRLNQVWRSEFVNAPDPDNFLTEVQKLFNFFRNASECCWTCAWEIAITPNGKSDHLKTNKMCTELKNWRRKVVVFCFLAFVLRWEATLAYEVGLGLVVFMIVYNSFLSSYAKLFSFIVFRLLYHETWLSNVTKENVHEKFMLISASMLNRIRVQSYQCLLLIHRYGLLMLFLFK